MYLYKNKRIGKNTRMTMRIHVKKNPAQEDSSAAILRLRCKEFIIGYTFCHVNPECWDKESRGFRSGFFDHDGKPISEWEEKLDEIYRALDTFLSSLPRSQRITKDAVNQIVLPIFGREVPEPVISADYLAYITERGRSRRWKERTIKKEMHSRRLFVDYVGSRQYQDITVSFMESFALSISDKIHKDTLRKIISMVGSFLEWAREHGRPVPEGRYVYRFNRVYSPIIYLSKNELRKIAAYSIPPSGTVVRLRDMHGRPYKKVVEGSGSMGIARDLLLFSCFTGLRWSEVQFLTSDYIRDDTLNFITPKTDTPRVVDLNRFARAIIDKYRPGTSDGHVFPRLSNQKVNKRLHDLAELCGINEPITIISLNDGEKTEKSKPKYKYISSHTGRRSFVCHALLAGLTPEMVTLWTGHSSVDEMRPYIAAAGEAQRKNMVVMYDSIFENDENKTKNAD